MCVLLNACIRFTSSPVVLVKSTLPNSFVADTYVHNISLTPPDLDLCHIDLHVETSTVDMGRDMGLITQVRGAFIVHVPMSFSDIP